MRTLCALAALVQLCCLIWLGRAERGGPAHLDLDLPGGTPATLYLPGPAPANGFLPEPPAAGSAPPVILLVHGYTADRAGMSVLARRLAANGYAVLAIDLRGHGENAAPFRRDPEGSNLFADTSTAADWLRASSWVDGSRLAVVGHSMGAGAALRFAERDVGVRAAIMISGGGTLLGPLRPRNALFIYASGDPERIRESAASLAARLSAQTGEPGSFPNGDAVRSVEMPGNDHTTILWSKAAAKEMIGWLDASFGLARGEPLNLAEPRAAPALLAAALLPLTLFGLGLAVGGVAPGWPRRDGPSRAALVALVLALLAALPLVAVAPLAAFTGLEVADTFVALLSAAGLLLCAGALLRGDRLLFEGERRALGGVPASLLAGGAGFAGVYALLAPLAGLVHRMTPIPPRALAGAALALLLLPFFLGFEHCVRRGTTLSAFGAGLVGRILTLAVILLGVSLGIVPFVVVLLLAPLAIAFILGEVLATGCYAAGANRLASAALQALFLAWMIAAAMPLRA